MHRPETKPSVDETRILLRMMQHPEERLSAPALLTNPMVLREMIKSGWITITRSEFGIAKYALTSEGRLALSDYSGVRQ